MSLLSPTTSSKVALGTGALNKSTRAVHRFFFLSTFLLATAGWIYFLATAIALIADKIL